MTLRSFEEYCIARTASLSSLLLAYLDVPAPVINLISYSSIMLYLPNFVRFTYTTF